MVKRWKRGQPLDQATEIYRGAGTDELGAEAETLNDGEGHHVTIIRRGPTFFEAEESLLARDGVKRIALPGKAQINGLVEGQIIVTLNQDWKPEGQDTELVGARLSPSIWRL